MLRVFLLTHFTHIFSNTSYIVDSSSSQVEFHLFVSVDCLLTDDELRDIISKPGDEDNSYVKELWFRGTHVCIQPGQHKAGTRVDGCNGPHFDGQGFLSPPCGVILQVRGEG